MGRDLRSKVKRSKGISHKFVVIYTDCIFSSCNHADSACCCFCDYAFDDDMGDLFENACAVLIFTNMKKIKFEGLWNYWPPIKLHHGICNISLSPSKYQERVVLLFLC